MGRAEIFQQAPDVAAATPCSYLRQQFPCTHQPHDLIIPRSLSPPPLPASKHAVGASRTCAADYTTRKMYASFLYGHM